MRVIASQSYASNTPIRRLSPLRKDYFNEKDLFLARIAIELLLTRFQIFVSINEKIILELNHLQ